jgi:hypothetical protein
VWASRHDAGRAALECFQCGFLRSERETALGFVRAVTLEAVLGKEGLNVALKIDSGGMSFDAEAGAEAKECDPDEGTLLRVCFEEEHLTSKSRFIRLGSDVRVIRKYNRGSRGFVGEYFCSAFVRRRERWNGSGGQRRSRSILHG